MSPGSRWVGDEFASGPSRRDLLRTAAMGAMVPSLLTAVEEPQQGPFLVPPYVQLGNAPHAANKESVTLLWHSLPKQGTWAVEFRSVGAANWRNAERVDSTLVEVQGVAAHDVSQCELDSLLPGVAVEYRVLLNGAVVFAAHAAVRAPAPQPFRGVVMGDVGAGSAEQKRVAFQVHRSRPEFVLDTWNPHIDWTDPALRDWLRKDLAAARHSTWKIVSSYMPPFSSSTRYPQGEKMRVIVDVLEEAGVDLVFSGYAHSYQRTYPLRFRPASPPTGPITDPGHRIPGTFAFDRRFDGPKLTVKQISLEGKELDQFVVTKRA